MIASRFITIHEGVNEQHFPKGINAAVFNISHPFHNVCGTIETTAAMRQLIADAQDLARPPTANLAFALVARVLLSATESKFLIMQLIPPIVQIRAKPGHTEPVRFGVTG